MLKFREEQTGKERSGVKGQKPDAKISSKLTAPVVYLQSSSKILEHLCAFPFPNVDLSITVGSVLQTTHGSTLGRVRAHYSALENTSVWSKSLENSRDAVSVSTICDEYCSNL